MSIVFLLLSNALFVCCCCRYQIVESMRLGVSPQQASENTIRRIMKYYPDFSGGVIAVNKTGHFGMVEWCHG